MESDGISTALKTETTTVDDAVVTAAPLNETSSETVKTEPSVPDASGSNFNVSSDPTIDEAPAAVSFSPTSRKGTKPAGETEMDAEASAGTSTTTRQPNDHASPSVNAEPINTTSSVVQVENSTLANSSEGGMPVGSTNPTLNDQKEEDDESEDEEEEPSTLEEVYDALGNLSSPGSTCNGGIATDLPSIPGLFVVGVGEVLLPLGPEGAEKLKKVARQAPHGRGMETIVDTAVRNTLEIDAEKVSLSNPAWPLGLAEVTRKVSVALGVNPDLVRPELYKLLLYETGGFFKKHRDTEKAAGMFATLVIQLPSRFTGGSFIVSHNGKSVTFPMAQHDTAPYYGQYVGFYADCEHEILPVESGLRLALVYSLCYTGNEVSKPSAADLDEESLVSVLKRLDRSDSLFSIPLKHQYTSISLARLGVGALKGFDREVSQTISRVDGWEMVVATVEKTDQETGEGGYWDGFEVYDTFEGDPSFTELFHEDGGDAGAHRGWLSRQLRLHSWEDGGMVLATTEECKEMWGEGEEGTIEYTGNEGATRETSYTMCILIAFSNEGVFERQCQSDFSDAVEEVQRKPILIDRIIKHIQKSKQDISSEHFIILHPLIEGRDSYWECFNVIFQGLSKTDVPTAGVFSILTSLAKKYGWRHDKFVPIRRFLAQLPMASKLAGALADQITALDSLATDAPPADVYLLRQSILERFAGLIEAQPTASHMYRSYYDNRAREVVWKSPKIEIVARELLLYGTPTLFERIETWVSTASLSILSEANSVFQKVNSSNIQPAHANSRDKCLSFLHRRYRELKVAELKRQENELLTKTQGGVPTFSWSMSNADSGNAAVDAFLRSNDMGPLEIVVGGGINNARNLADKSDKRRSGYSSTSNVLLMRGYSAEIVCTHRTGRAASVIVTKTKSLHKTQVKVYNSNVKALADVRAELEKLGVRSNEAVPQPVAKRAKSDPEVIVID